jgi:hypothetical protein
MALIGALVSACLSGDCPCGYNAHFANASDSPALVQFRSTPYKIGDDPSQYDPDTVFVVPPRAVNAVSPRVYMDWADGPWFGPPLPVGQIVLLAKDCSVLASFDVRREGDPQIVIGGDGATMDRSPSRLLGQGILLEPTTTLCPAR